MKKLLVFIILIISIGCGNSENPLNLYRDLCSGVGVPHVSWVDYHFFIYPETDEKWVEVEYYIDGEFEVITYEYDVFIDEYKEFADVDMDIYHTISENKNFYELDDNGEIDIKTGYCENYFYEDTYPGIE